MLRINLLSPKPIGKYWGIAEFNYITKAKDQVIRVRIFGGVSSPFYHISKVKGPYIFDIPN